MNPLTTRLDQVTFSDKNQGITEVENKIKRKQTE